MQIEIKRIGLVSAGSCGALLAGAAAVVGGTLRLVGLGLRNRLFEVESMADGLGLDLGRTVSPEAEAGMLGLAAMMQVGLAGLAAVIGGFLIGLFGAAVYNVAASIAGGLVVEMEPVPER